MYNKQPIYTTIWCEQILHFSLRWAAKPGVVIMAFRLWTYRRGTCVSAMSTAVLLVAAVTARQPAHCLLSAVVRVCDISDYVISIKHSCLLLKESTRIDVRQLYHIGETICICILANATH